MKITGFVILVLAVLVALLGMSETSKAYKRKKVEDNFSSSLKSAKTAQSRKSILLKTAIDMAKNQPLFRISSSSASACEEALKLYSDWANYGEDHGYTEGEITANLWNNCYQGANANYWDNYDTILRITTE